MGDSDATTVYHVLKNRVPAPSFVRSEVPRSLDAIVLRGLKADPNARWETAKAMAEALEGSAKPVARSAVARWVTETAKDTICQRQALVSAVESAVIPVRSLRLPPPLPAVRAVPGGQSTGTGPMDALDGAATESSDAGSPGSGTRLKETAAPVSQTVSRAPRRTTRKAFWAALVVGSVVGAAALTWTKVRAPRAPAPVAPTMIGTQADSPRAISQPPPSMPPESPAAQPAEPSEPPSPVVSATPSATPAAKSEHRQAAPVVKANPVRPKAKHADRIYRRD
jgi:hypothetical protein